MADNVLVDLSAVGGGGFEKKPTRTLVVSFSAAVQTIVWPVDRDCYVVCMTANNNTVKITSFDSGTATPVTNTVHGGSGGYIGVPLANSMLITRDFLPAGSSLYITNFTASATFVNIVLEDV